MDGKNIDYDNRKRNILWTVISFKRQNNMEDWASTT